MAWLGLAWLGLAWLGLAWLGLAWLGRIYGFVTFSRLCICALVRLYVSSSMLRFQELTGWDWSAPALVHGSFIGVGLGKRSEPRRVCRRPFRLSHAAMAGSSSMA
ncbi:MAG: hypothetical protein EOR95_32015 [Mesorhizobium sp.]|nr:MAG: hypothetical protein EOR95_32015 [Mesorhizobium sp.]